MKNKTKSLSPREYKAAVDRLEAKFCGYGSEFSDTGKIMSECIHELGGLFGGVYCEVAPKDWWFFRVRTSASFINESEMLDPSQYSYPPANICTWLGRCHVPGRPVFYGSDSYECAMAEMKQPNERDYLISQWRLPKRPVALMKFLCETNIKSGRLMEHKSKILTDAYKQEGIVDHLKIEHLRSFLTAWSDLFLSKFYSLSSAISDQLNYGSFSHRHDLLAYGSALGGNYINFAIPPKLADTMTLDKVFRVQYETSGQNAITWLACFEPDSKCVWRDVNKSDYPHSDERIPTKLFG